jgi:inosose dehydratase
MITTNISRRQVLSMMGAGVIACAGGLPASAAPKLPIKLGVATYTFRKFSLQDTIRGIRQVGLEYASIKDFHLPLKSSREERQRVAKSFRDAGITPLSCGVITLRNEEAGARNAFEYARDAGIPTIVCNPDPAALPMLESLVKEFDIRLAIHNHGPEDKRWPTPFEAYGIIKPLDRRIGLCNDVGHTLRAGKDPAEAMIRFADRMYDVHLKDIDKAAPDGRCCEAGRGVLDIKAVLAALVQIRFEHLVGFEYEKDPGDPIPGLDESVKHTRKLLASL